MDDLLTGQEAPRKISSKPNAKYCYAISILSKLLDVVTKSNCFMLILRVTN